MPELPEVETLRRSLVPRLQGRRMGSVEVRERRLREPVDAPRLRRELPGRRVEGLRRRAKYLLIDLEGDRSLVVHLGMSGRLTWWKRVPARDLHDHLDFTLDDGSHLVYRDPRRFGLVFAAATSRLERNRHLRHLGPEPLEPDFDGACLAAAARGRRGAVRNLLLDARAVAGVGNIYATEALFRAGIHPARRADRIARRRWDLLAAAVREVLDEAIARGGTTLRDYRNGDGVDGMFQAELTVYGREGEPCRRCGATIRRQVLAGRSSFHCPGCQR